MEGADFIGANIKYTNFKLSKMDNKTKINEKWKKIQQINTKSYTYFMCKNMSTDINLMNEEVCVTEFIKLKDFSEAVLTNSRFSYCNFEEGTNFDGSDLGSSVFINCILKKSKFQIKEAMTNLQMVSFSHSDLQASNFKEANMVSSQFVEGTNLADSHFDKCYLNSAKFINCNLTRVTFKECYLSNCPVEFTGSDLTEVCFEKCNIDNIELDETQRGQVRFIDCYNNNGETISKPQSGGP